MKTLILTAILLCLACIAAFAGGTESDTLHIRRLEKQIENMRCDIKTLHFRIMLLEIQTESVEVELDEPIQT